MNCWIPGIFDEDRYFDVFVEYAKETPEDILIKITVANRGPEPADLHRTAHALVSQYLVVWMADRNAKAEPRANRDRAGHERAWSSARIRYLANDIFHCEGDAPLLFTENETNNERIFPAEPNRKPVRQRRHQRLRRTWPADAVNPGKRAPRPPRIIDSLWRRQVGDGAAAADRSRRRRRNGAATGMPFGKDFDEIWPLASARRTSSTFGDPAFDSPDAANVMRQALAGMLWSKQYYFFDVDSG